jgi:hypothetical protein
MGCFCGRNGCEAAWTCTLCGHRTGFAGRLPDRAFIVALSAAKRRQGFPDSRNCRSSLGHLGIHHGEKRPLHAPLRQNPGSRLATVRVSVNQEANRWMRRLCVRCRRH